ncbi:ABC transporter ATP-binding protein [Alkalihalobacillus pseudalcaliphilus]|uniref:ABC transporter ATP-binding protein n=1 Tax=Alkalihalobacillus pseudalcaliphilus TaxID=79884 RepID=UPI00064DF3DD|nr:ABC transporter ATP-binding protein [Alkalihalobacillus pseudalcaliphilus]KMK76611.1 bacitracin ABC transporter ATP-binding protein [Alkalihalobacillus pseudalcaliphilus]
MKAFIVETKQLSKKFNQDYAVSNVNLKVEEGDIYGFLGPNGAGKTTTIRMLLGLTKPSQGEVHLFGKSTKGNHLHALRQIGSLVESPSYYPHLTGYENLEALRKILQVPSRRIHEVLEIVQLTKYADRKVKAYSLGMKQRLGIAASLLGEPKLLILDEPTNGLDPSGIHEIRDLIKSLPKEFGITVLISSHLLHEIDQVANKVGIISKGKLIFQDSIEVLRAKAQSQIRIKTADLQRAKKDLWQIGIISEIKQGTIVFGVISEAEIANAIRILVEKGHDIYRVEEVRRSLEEIFLDVTAQGGLNHA